MTQGRGESQQQDKFQAGADKVEVSERFAQQFMECLRNPLLYVPKEHETWIADRIAVLGLAVPVSQIQGFTYVKPHLIDVSVFMTPASHVNWNTLTVSTTALYNGYKQSASTINSEISFDVALDAGTWTVELLHVKASDSGIYHVQIDGVDQGTVDGYNAATSVNQLGSVTGVIIDAQKRVTLTLKIASKNASSSNYVARLQHVQLRRTS